MGTDQAAPVLESGWKISQHGEGLGQGKPRPKRPRVRKVDASNLTVWPQANSDL